MRITTANLLLEAEPTQIYDSETRLVRASPKRAKAAASEELRSRLMEQLAVTRNQVQRIEQIFELLGVPAKAKPCDGMKGIIAEGDEMLGEVEGSVKDVAITSAARRVEHYEMAAYAGAHAIAEQLGNREIADLLQENWDEEREADEKLGQLAVQILQTSAATGEEMPAAGKTARRSPGTPKARRAGE